MISLKIEPINMLLFHKAEEAIW